MTPIQRNKMMLLTLVTLLLADLCLAISKKPNILFILTDDQDLHMEAGEHMPYLQVCLTNDVIYRKIDPNIRRRTSLSAKALPTASTFAQLHFAVLQEQHFGLVELLITTTLLMLLLLTVAIQKWLNKVSMTIISSSGCKPLATIPTIPANCGIFIRSIIFKIPMRKALMDLIFYWTRTHTSIGMQE